MPQHASDMRCQVTHASSLPIRWSLVLCFVFYSLWKVPGYLSHPSWSLWILLVFACFWYFVWCTIALLVMWWPSLPLFSLRTLTEGRSVRDLPKQHPEKKIFAIKSVTTVSPLTKKEELLVSFSWKVSRFGDALRDRTNSYESPKITAQKIDIETQLHELWL